MENNKPITPQQVKDSLPEKLPTGFIEQVNKAIEDKFNGESSEIKLGTLLGVSQKDLGRKFTIIKAIYREAGWEKVSLRQDGTLVFSV